MPLAPLDRGDWLAGAQITTSDGDGSSQLEAAAGPPGALDAESEFRLTAVNGTHVVGLASFYKSGKWLDWWGDGVLARLPEVQMRPPSALPRPPPTSQRANLRPQSAAAKASQSSKGSSHRRRASQESGAEVAAQIVIEGGDDDGASPTVSVQLEFTAKGAARPRKDATILVDGRPLHMAKPATRAPLSQQDVYYMLTKSNLNPEAAAKAAKARELAAERANRRVYAEKRAKQQAKAAEAKAEAAAFAAEREKLLTMFGFDMERIKDPSE